MFVYFQFLFFYISFFDLILPNKAWHNNIRLFLTVLWINISKWPYVIARCCITCPGYSTILNVLATSSSGLVWSIWQPWKETGTVLLHKSAFAVTTLILFKIQLDSSQLGEHGNWCLEGQRGARCHKSQGGIHGNPGTREPPKQALAYRHRHAEIIRRK